MRRTKHELLTFCMTFDTLVFGYFIEKMSSMKYSLLLSHSQLAIRVTIAFSVVYTVKEPIQT